MDAMAAEEILAELSDDELVSAANEVFLSYDRREQGN
jgi:hypothetical protein